jgi:UDP-N-acetylmuramoyl-L-alanyl-D-glutamate--2,6-diaminopimelate ligase
MRLNDVLRDTGLQGPELEVLGLTADSREVLPGFLFAALDGVKLKGSAFIDQAIDRGARAIIAGDVQGQKSVPILAHENPRQALALCARNFFEFLPATMAAVTGTNGKTSVVTLLRQIWTHAGHKAASLGTLGVEADGYHAALMHTTPDPVRLHAALRDLVALDVSHCCMEASSHGLAQNRLDGVRVDCAGFTNLTQDHMDYHSSFDDYREAKFRLFMDVLTPDGVAVVSVGSAVGQSLASILHQAGRRVVTVGAPEAMLHVVGGDMTATGQAVQILWDGERHDSFMPLVGAFQCENLAVALAMAVATGVEKDAALASVRNLGAPTGRMHYVGASAAGAHLYVDYAHTPDALERALVSLRAHCTGQLHVVFGCGGERDSAKRPMMGAIACALADHIIITDDNPRGEVPAFIRAQIRGACDGATEIADRAEAIRSATQAAGAGDIILIAGKGHEQGQIIDDQVLPFSDLDVAQAFLAEGGRA